MATDSGLQMMNALKAVRHMHQDARKLLKDIDAMVDTYVPIRTDAVHGISVGINSGVYMADGLYRHYSDKVRPNNMLGVNIAFFDFNNRLLLEPIIVAANITYLDLEDAKRIPDRRWDPWNLFDRACEDKAEQMLDSTFVASSPEDELKVVSATVRASALFTLHSRQDVQALMNPLLSPA